MDPFKTKKTTKDHLVSLTQELVRFPSFPTEPLKIFELAEFIKSYFAKDKLSIAEYTINGLPALVIATESTKHPHILMSGHLDVVPSSSNCTPDIDGDKMSGAGTMDMKGGVATMMAVLKYFAKQKNPPSLGLMLTSDEEMGGYATQVLVNEEGFSPDMVIVGEGRSKYEIVTREKGQLVLRLVYEGKSLHSAYPWKGKNSLEELMRVCVNIKKHFPKARDGWYPTVSVTNVRGGQELNTIPAEAEAILFFRLTGGKRWSRDKIYEFLKKNARYVKVEELLYGDILQVDEKDERVLLMRDVARKVTGRRIGFGFNHGGSDGRFFNWKGIPTIVLGPVGKNSHSADEYVLISSLVEHFMVLKRFVEEETKVVRSAAKELIKGKV